jgi:hypothetical protein
VEGKERGDGRIVKKLIWISVLIAILMIMPVSANWFEGACQETATVIIGGYPSTNTYLGQLNETSIYQGYGGAPGDYLYACNGTQKVLPQYSLSPGFYGTFGPYMLATGKYGISSTATSYGQRYWLNYRNLTADPLPPVVNVTFSISKSDSFATKLANVTVTVSSGQSGITATNGTVKIGVTPNSSSYTYTLTKSGYSTVSGASLGGYGESGGTIYATMTALTAGYTNYTLVATPKEIIPGQNISVTLTTSSGNYTQIANLGIKCWPGTCTDTAGRLPVYQRQGSTWYQLDDSNTFTISKGSTFPVTGLTLTGLITPGTNEVKATIWETGGLSVEAKDYVNVSGTGQFHTITIEAVDEKWGGTIHSAQVHLKPASTGVWQVRSLLADSVEFQVQHGEYFTHYVTATGYLDSETTGAYANENMFMKTVLRQIVDTPFGNTTLDVMVNRFGLSDGLNGVLVRMSDGTSKTTLYSGVVSFTLLNNTQYRMTCTKDGYQTQIYVVNTLGSQQAVSVYMWPLTQATPTPKVTDPITGDPITVVPTLDIRTNQQKGDSAVKIVYDNAEAIIWALIILFFVGCIKMAKKGW